MIDSSFKSFWETVSETGRTYCHFIAARLTAQFPIQYKYEEKAITVTSFFVV
jgi:hypothetical protein